MAQSEGNTAGKTGSVAIDDLQWRDGSLEARQDCIIEEVPVALAYNGISQAVMMVTPVQLKEFALGFSLTEGIVDGLGDVYDIAFESSVDGYTIQLEISSRVFERLRQRRRQLTGRSGCGLCGLESLQAVRQSVPMVAPVQINPDSINHAVTQLVNHQPLQQLTGAAHGAAWCCLEGQIQFVCEDVGRHNALDKLIGARLLKGDDSQGFILVSSRSSYEMVQKTAMAGVATLVSLSAATSMAVDLARQAGITLVGFARDRRHVIYNETQQTVPR